MRRGTSFTATVLAIWIIPMASFAADAGGTEPSLWERAKTLRASLETRIPESAAALVPDAAKKKSWEAERKRLEVRKAELRAKCREEIRKANRDTILAKSEQCFRGDLLEEISLHRKEQAYIASLPGIDANVQAAFQDALKKLIDAEVAVVNGVDTGVYASVELLQSAKRKLRDQYRVPYRTALFHLSTDRQIPWLAWHADQLEYLLSEKPETDAQGAVTCMEEAVHMASASLVSDATTALETLRATLAKNLECIKILRDLTTTEG